MALDLLQLQIRNVTIRRAFVSFGRDIAAVRISGPGQVHPGRPHVRFSAQSGMGAFPSTSPSFRSSAQKSAGMGSFR